MKNKKLVMGVLLLVSVFVLAACSNSNEEKNQEGNDGNMEMDEDMDMGESGSAEVPDDLKVAKNPKYEVGDQVIIEAGHMKGMKGAEATVVGAFDTTAYAISYTPKTGGERVENHKWVIQEEIVDAGEEPLEPGTEVKIDASHMEGMDGVTATIDTAKQTTVYMLDYIPTTGGEKVTNHKWVIESELSAK